MADDAVTIAIEAVDRATGTLAKVGASYGDLGEAGEKAAKKLTSVDDAIAKLVKQEKLAQVNRDAAAAFENLTQGEKDAILAAQALREEQAKLAESTKRASNEAESGGSKFKALQMTVIAANQAAELVGRGFSTVKKIIDDTAGATVEYAKQVRDLSTNLGISAEETSKLIQTADDYGISVEAITSALQMAVKRGFAPNIETIAKLADEYNRIADPTERAARLTDVFGRGWTALTPMLKAGGNAIRDAAAEAEKLGLVLSDKDVQAARALEVGVDNLNDKVEALKYKIGKELIPVLINLADTGNKAADVLSGNESELDGMIRKREYLISLYGRESAQVQEATKYIEMYKARMADANDTSEEAARAHQTMANNLEYFGRQIGLTVPSFDDLANAEEHAATKAKLLEERFAGLKVAIGGALKDEMESFGEKQTDLADKAAKLRTEIEKLEASQGKQVTSTREQKLSAAEAALAQIQLTKAQTAYNEETQKMVAGSAEAVAAQEKLATAQSKLDDILAKDSHSTRELEAAQRNLADAQSQMAATADPEKQAELAVKVEKLKEKLGEASGAVVSYVDNSKKIGELKGQYDEINKEIAANAKAHEEATNRIIFGYAEQQLAIDGFTEKEFQALDKLSVQLGLKSEEDVAAFETIRNAARDLAADGSVDVFIKKIGSIPGVEVPMVVDEKAADESLKKTMDELNRSAVAGGGVEIPVTLKTTTEKITAQAGDSFEERRAQFEKTKGAAEGAASSIATSTSKAIGAVGDVASKTTDKVKAVVDTTDKSLGLLANSTMTKYNSVAGSIVDAFSKAAGSALSDIFSVATEIDKLPTFKQFVYQIVVRGQIPDISSMIPGAARGADFIVPPNPYGGAGDYFPVLAAPGERVTVQTKAQQTENKDKKAGDTITYTYNTNIYNPLAAAMLADKQRRDRVARSNARMGVT